MDGETTMCWRCNAEMGFSEPKCPKCGATNANVDLDLAIKEMQGPANA